MANKLRNEIEITLAGVKRTMRADFEAMISIETDLRMNIVVLLTKLSQMDMGLKDAEVILFHGLHAFDSDVLRKDVGEALMKTGLNNVMGPIINFLKLALDGVSLGKSKEAATD
jgi:hypothetical protein